MSGKVSEEVLVQVLKATRATEEILREILKERDVEQVKVAKIEVKLQSVEDDLVEMVQIIRGDGLSGLQMQANIQCTRLALVEEKLKEEKDKGSKLSVEKIKGRWSLFAIVASGLVALATAMITAAIALLGKG